MQSPLLFVTEFLRLQNDDEFPQRPGKGERHSAVIFFKNRSPGVLPDVESFIKRETNTDGLRNSALGDLLFIDQQRCCRALADAAAVIGELTRMM